MTCRCSHAACSTAWWPGEPRSSRYPSGKGSSDSTSTCKAAARRSSSTSEVRLAAARARAAGIKLAGHAVSTLSRMTAANIRSGRLRELAFCQPDEGDKCRYRPLCQAAQRRALQLSLADAECSASGQVCPGNASHSRSYPRSADTTLRRRPPRRGPAPPLLYPRRDRLRVGPGLPAQPAAWRTSGSSSSPSDVPSRTPATSASRSVGPPASSRSTATAAVSSSLPSSRHRARCRASPQISAISRRSASGR